MKFLVIASVCAAMVYGQGQKVITPETAVRNLPADVLRDFPGACFASTACRVFQVGQTWPLTPFCGQATCLFINGTYVEMVEDCGLRPKDSPGCVVANEETLQDPFPGCCPQYVCEEGFTLLYPTQEELRAAAALAASAQAAGAQASATQTPATQAPTTQAPAAQTSAAPKTTAASGSSA